MKKIILIMAVAGIVSLSSCEKCNICSGADINELNHTYCNSVYRTDKTMKEAQDQCEARGGTWTPK